MKNYDLVYERTPARWLDGVPLGNGYLGVMLWGDGRPLRLTLDKPDVWELRETRPDPKRFRYDVIRKLVAEKRWGEINHIVHTLPVGSRKTDRPYPTRFPLPRMEIQSLPYDGGRLGLETATWRTQKWQAFAHATRKLFVMQGLAGNEEIKVDYLPKGDPSIVPSGWGWPQECLPAWGYPPLERGEANGIFWVRQVIPESGEYVIAWRLRDSELLLTILTHRDAPHPRAAAMQLLAKAPAWKTLVAEHRAWWQQFWARSAITLPDKRLENLYVAELYKLGSCCRPDGVAMPLCGVWMHDQVMPYCWNDYHLDLNVEQAYWPVYASNHLELGYSLYETFWKMLPRFRENCRRFYGIDGLWTSCSIALNGAAMCFPRADLKKVPPPNPVGWEPLACTPSMLPWLTHNYWLHYRYSRDLAFLKDRVLPLLKGCWQVYAHVLEKGSDGKLHLPVSHSPEYMECTPEVWQKDTSFDAALVRFVCHALLEAERVLNLPDADHARYEEMLANLYDYPGEDQIWIGADTPLAKSHRHHCHLLGLYPLEELTIEGSERDRKRIEKSMEQVFALGTGEWCGHAYTAYAQVAARAGYANACWKWLQDYLHLIGPNTLVWHGDPRRFGVTRFTFAITGTDTGFAWAAAVLEMLLQSWGGLIRVFPAVPEFWADVSFRNLLAEGAVEVSAEKRQGRVRWIELKARQAGCVRVKNVFDGSVRVNRAEQNGQVLEIVLKKGQTVRLEPVAAAGKDAPAGQAGLHVQGANWFGLKQIPNF